MITAGGRFAAGLVLVVAGAVSSGCASSSDGAVALPSLSGSSSQAPSGSSATPSGSASGDVKAEVEAAVRAYFAAMDIAGRTGDTQPYEAATTGDCTCREFAKTVEQAYAQAPLVGAGVVLRSVDVTLLQEGRAHAVADYRTLNYTQTISATPTRFPGWSVQSLIRLSRTSNGWLVIDEDVISRTAA